jgi:DNA polymerase-3 subunit delta'
MAPRKKPAAAAESAYPTPRQQQTLIGHTAALAGFEEGFGRLAQSWLITGPEGIGKATFAYHLARRLLTMQARQGALPREVPVPVARRVSEASHSDLHVLEAPKGKEIGVDAVREMQHFLHLTAAESAWRLVVVDTADAMNTHAANALLKLLEEPPAGAVLLLLSHAPGKLLPTIRSRCRVLALSPLSEAESLAVLKSLALPEESLRGLAALSDGSPGIALLHHEAGSLALMESLLELLVSYPKLSVPAITAWAEKAASRTSPHVWPAVERLLLRLLHGVVCVASGLAPPASTWPAESAILHRIAAHRPLAFWLALWDKTTTMFREHHVLHFDARQMVLEFFFQLESSVSA